MEWEIDEGPLLQWAGAALGGARLSLVRVLRAHPKLVCNVVRCQVEDSASGLPATLIVKQANWTGHGLAEQIGLDFLNALSAYPDKVLVPKLWAADSQHELVVMEDLGEQSLGHILGEDDRQQAYIALMGFAQSLGMLHGASMGLEDLHAETSQRLAPRRTWGTTDRQINDCLRAFPGIRSTERPFYLPPEHVVLSRYLFCFGAPLRLFSGSGAVGSDAVGAA